MAVHTVYHKIFVPLECLLSGASPSTLCHPETTTQMRPRWIGFVSSLFGSGSYVLVVLQIPTVVMSRHADQQSKVSKGASAD